MFRCDKTFSELWNLRGKNDGDLTYSEFKEQASDTAFMAINTIKKLQEENRIMRNALEEIGAKYDPSTSKIVNDALCKIKNKI